MTSIILSILAFIVFAYYRYRKYQKAREIETMAADAQAFVSAEVVELLQRYKTIMAQQEVITTSTPDKIQQRIKNLSESLLCHTDSEASVREYLSFAKQNIAIIQLELDKMAAQHDDVVSQSFDALK